MTVFRPPVYDADGEIVTLSDVGPIDPAREHDVATCEVEDCWACAGLSKPIHVYPCYVADCVVCEHVAARIAEAVA